MRPGLVVAALAVFGLAFFRPEQAVARGVTWAQIAKATDDARMRHGVTTIPNGSYRSEFWSNGPRYASITQIKGRARKLPNGRILPAESSLMEHRNDGRRNFSLYTGSLDGPRSGRPNALRAGYISNLEPTSKMIWRDAWHDYPGQRDLLEDLLAKKDVRILKDSVIAGRREIALSLIDPLVSHRPRTGTVVVDEGGRIVEARDFGLFKGEVTRYDYPTEIPSKIFEPRPQIWPAQVLDHGRMRRQVLAGLANGLGTDRGITLRAVLIDRVGDLHVLYSGAVPPGSLPQSIRIKGIPASKPFGLKPFTQSTKQPAFAGKVRLGGMSVTPKKILPERITLYVPAVRGEAVFRDVPITRIEWIYDLSYDVGLARRK